MYGLGGLLVVRALLSWLPNLNDNPIVNFINSITDPLLNQIRRLIPPVGAIDISILIFIIILFAIGGVLLDFA